MSIKTDRNFDDLAQKFARKVYGELKGDIRLAVIWRDLLAAVSGLADGSSLRILDIGGGLGQLSIRTAELGHRVIYNDLSVEMLSLAQAEADKAKIKDKITWHQGEYQNLEDQLEGRFDLIVSNPPYIALEEWDGLDFEVRGFDPRMALTDEAVGLSCYHVIVAQAGAYLEKDGYLMVEVGHTQGRAVQDLYDAAGFTQITCLSDMSGRDRVVSGVWAF